jgi:MoaA/NifB/PqqE/SkfB family radical SAM enzyme
MRFSTITSVATSVIKLKVREMLGLPQSAPPYKLLIQMTNDCNSRCKACLIWTINKEAPEKKERELQLDHYKQIFLQWGKNLRWLALSGGEVTMVSYFKEVIDLACLHCPNLRLVAFTTNGLLPEVVLDYARYIRSKQKDLFVTISLDGDEELHDRIRGVRGNYQLVQEAFAKLRAEGFQVQFGMTIHESNSDFIVENYPGMAGKTKAVSLSHSHGVFKTKVPLESRKIFKALQTVTSHYQKRSAGEWIEFAYLKLGLIFLGSDRTDVPLPCSVLSSSLHIMPDGEVHPCMYLPSLGNVKRTPLNEILGGPKAQQARERIRKLDCAKCWMNCYAPHSIMQYPLKAISRMFRKPASGGCAGNKRGKLPERRSLTERGAPSHS